MFVDAWKDTPGLVHNRHVQQARTLVDVPQRRKTTRKTPKELKELRRLKMEKLEAAQKAADERRRAQLGVRRQMAERKGSYRKDSVATRESGQAGGKNSAWTVEEMELLLALVEKHGMGNWEIVAAGLTGDRSVGSITQKYYKITRGDGARGRRTKRTERTSSNATSTAQQWQKQQQRRRRRQQEELAEEEDPVYNEWDDPTVPESELNVLQRALRHEKELRSTNVDSQDGKMSELQIQEELSTQFGDDVKEHLFEEAERLRKARRKNPQPTEWDFDLLFQGWRWDVREHGPERPLYRDLLTQPQVLRLARRGGHRKLAEFLYNLDEPEDDGTLGAPSHLPGLKAHSDGPVYQKVEYDNGSVFWGKMREDNGQEEIGCYMDERKKKKMVQFVDGKMYFLRKEDASYPVAEIAKKKAEEAPTQPTIASPRSTRAAAKTQQRVPARRKVRPADTPILSAIGSWRYSIRHASTVAATQLHLSCLVSAMAWSRVATVDMCDRPLVAPPDVDLIQALTIPPDPERECWMELAVRGTLDAVISAVTLQMEASGQTDPDAPTMVGETTLSGPSNMSSAETSLKALDTGSEEVLGVGVLDDTDKEELKQGKRLDNLLAPYDKRRAALEKVRRTTMSNLKVRLLQKQNSETMARRRADNVAAQKQAYVTASATAATAAAAAAAAGRVAMNRGGGSGSGRRKGQDWTEEELKRLVDLVKVHGRYVAVAVCIISCTL
jgi:hypothetical protein